jgi:hypothetical protein
VEQVTGISGLFMIFTILEVILGLIGMLVIGMSLFSTSIVFLVMLPVQLSICLLIQLSPGNKVFIIIVMRVNVDVVGNVVMEIVVFVKLVVDGVEASLVWAVVAVHVPNGNVVPGTAVLLAHADGIIAGVPSY